MIPTSQDPLLSQDYFAVGRLLVERLKAEELSPIVDQIATLDMLDAKNLPSTTGVYVSMIAEDVGNVTGDGIATQMFQTWAVTPIVFNARYLDVSMGPQTEIGRLIMKIHQLIAGWRPTEDYGYFIRVPGGAPQYLEEHWIYSLGFQIQVPIFSEGIY